MKINRMYCTCKSCKGKFRRYIEIMPSRTEQGKVNIRIKGLFMIANVILSKEELKELLK